MKRQFGSVSHEAVVVVERILRFKDFLKVEAMVDAWETPDVIDYRHMWALTICCKNGCRPGDRVWSKISVMYAHDPYILNLRGK